MVKESLSALAIVLTLIAYIRGILKEEIRPHLFSWVI